MAVQSDDTPPGRPCEQCAAEALNGGVKHSPPYIWNNSNYLLKMTEDLTFLTGVDPLVSWLAAGDGNGVPFELEGNPFLLAPPAEGEEEQIIVEVRWFLFSLVQQVSLRFRGDSFAAEVRQAHMLVGFAADSAEGKQYHAVFLGLLVQLARAVDTVLCALSC